VHLVDAVSPPLNPSVSRPEFHRYGRRSQVHAIRAWLLGSLHRSASQNFSRILRLWDPPNGEAKATLKPTAANSVARFWWIWSALILLVLAVNLVFSEEWRAFGMVCIFLAVTLFVLLNLSFVAIGLGWFAATPAVSNYSRRIVATRSYDRICSKTSHLPTSLSRLPRSVGSSPDRCVDRFCNSRKRNAIGETLLFYPSKRRGAR
jgi:hypothetical protein